MVMSEMVKIVIRVPREILAEGGRKRWKGVSKAKRSAIMRHASLSRAKKKS
jgi:hypothetical protein